MSAPTRAVLLAAGFGSRMKPMTCDLPKPMMPLGSTPLIGHMLDMLTDWGVHDVLVNLHHCTGPLFDYLTRQYRGPLRIQLSYEPEILGTGGALRKAQWFAQGAPLWMLNTDILALLDPAPLLKAMRRPHAAAALWVTDEAGPRTVERDGQGCVTTFRSPRAGAEGTYTFCGLQLLHPRIIDNLPASGFASIITAYETAMAAGGHIIACPIHNSRWADLGTPARYLAAATNNGETSQIAPTAQVHPAARVEGSVIWPGAHLGPRARVHKTVVCRNVRLNVEVDAPTLQLETLGSVSAMRAARLLGWNANMCICSVLPRRGSDRMFLRLAKGTRSVLVASYGKARAENDNYAALAACLLKLGVPVPAVIAHDRRSRIMVMEDLGCTDLLRHVEGASPRTIERAYEEALDVLARLQALRVTDVPSRLRQPCFDAALYAWEHELFVNHLCRDRLGLNAATCKAIAGELTGLSKRLLKRPHQTLVHRDFQSTNILRKTRQLYLIDFQGIRAGCAAYDAASLLFDPYVMLAEGLQQKLLAHYLAEAPQGIDETACREAACQRLVQALGAFARLASLPDTRRFEDHIAPGANMLLRALEPEPKVDNLRALMSNISEEIPPC